MTKSFIGQRPTIPIGTQVSDFLISRPLHCDEDCELYHVERFSNSDVVVLLLPIKKNKSLESIEKAQKIWWSKFSSSINCKYSEKYVAFSKEFALFVLEIKGDWAGDIQEKFREFRIDELAINQNNLVDQIKDITKDGSAPSFKPSLVWIRPDAREFSVISIVCFDQGKLSEQEVLAEIVSLYLFVLYGVDSCEGGSNFDKKNGQALDDKLKFLLKCQKNLNSTSEEITLDNFFLELSILSKSTPRAEKTSSKEGQLSGLQKVAGMQRLKSLLSEEVIAPLRDPEKFKRYGLTVPNGILLFGPPGCGKTYISKQLAEELGFYFIEVIPSEIAGIHVHESVLNIRNIFDRAARKSPTVIFIDEFEALVPSRSELGGHQSYKSEEVNEILVQLGTCAEKRILLIAATNEPAKIDAAVRRTGRLDKLIYVGPPDLEARKDMLKLHLRNRPVGESLDIDVFASKLDGYSASDLKFLVDEAARAAMRASLAPISINHFLEAQKKVPASIKFEDEVKYEGFYERGVND
ncbi:ATP-binding protein [bacterium]|nr:ATP-binding protein [bacterium]